MSDDSSSENKFESQTKHYTCTLCNKVYLRRQGLNTHMKTTHNDQTFKCDDCGKEFACRAYLAVHISRHSGQTFECEECKKVFLNKKGLQNHIKMTHSGLTFECDECGKAFKSKYHLARHSQTVHHGVKPYQCNDCDKAFTAIVNLRYHINSAHTKEELKKKDTCPVCSKTLMRNQMIWHMKIHTAEDRHECPECKKILLSKKSLKIHFKKQHTSEGQHLSFTCEHCGNEYSSIYSLRNHMATHTDDRPVLKCKFCGKSYLSKIGLLNHERLHTGEEPYFCQYCHKSFRVLGVWKEHEKKHTGERLKCGVCSKELLTPKSLKRHMLEQHSKGKSFPCPNAPNCPKRFKRKKSSRDHFLICRAEKPVATESSDEEESSSKLSSPVRRRCGRRTKAPESQQPESTGLIFKNCFIDIKRNKLIERAVREGYTSFTHVPLVNKGEKRRVWKITGLIGANNRCGSGWVRRKI